MRHFYRQLCITLILIFLLMVPHVAYGAEDFHIHVLDVGEGQSVLIEADGHYMMIDGGGRAASSFVVSYMKQLGISRFDYLAASHYDEDHMSGLIGILNVFPCDVLLLPPYKGDTALYNSFASSAMSNGCLIMHPIPGDFFSMGQASIEVIGPISNDYDIENNLSLSFRICYGDTACLVCGDAESQSELDMVANIEELHADIYVVNHHGSSTSSMDAFLEAVSPKYAIISCGSDNLYGHPSLETLQRLQNHGVSLFRTDKQGTIRVDYDGEILFNVQPTEDWGTGDRLLTLEPSEDVEDSGAITRTSPNLMEEERGESPPEDLGYSYVCNTHTKKIHYPYCSSVNQMKEENKLYTNLSREELIAEGYEPCGNCKP